MTGLARRNGFRPARVFLSMSQNLSEPVRAAPVPPGLDVRPFDPDLDEAVRLAKNEAFRDHWNGTADDEEQWRTRMLGDTLDRARSRVAIDRSGAIAGFVLVRRVEHRPERMDLPLVGTVREHRRRGIALAGALEAGALAGYTEATLDVDSASPTGADRTYASSGFVETGRATVWSRPLN